MSDTHEAKIAATVQPQLHDEHSVDLNNYIRRCVFIFIAILCAVSLMIWISFLPANYSWALKSALILAVAACNAFVVAGFLMHLISEKKMIYTVLGFTAIFVAGLFWLTWYAMRDFPAGTTMH
jgi:FtsH-binding integral membrane protein